jgi:predicted HicB family RNase H-like nuclease
MAKKKPSIPPPPDAQASDEELAAYFEKYGLEELEAAGYVQDLSQEEQNDMEQLAAHCRARIESRKTARTQLNLAMSPEQLHRFTQYAQTKHIPPSTLAKAWLLERLDQEAKEA